MGLRPDGLKNLTRKKKKKSFEVRKESRKLKSTLDEGT